MFRCRSTIIGNRAAQFEAAGELLRMFASHAGVRRKIRRAAGDEIEFFSAAQNSGFSKIALADFVAVGHAVVARGFSGERDAFSLRLDRHKLRPGQPPRADHADGADAAAEVQHAARRRAPTRAVPRRQNVVGGKAVAVAQLKQAEMPADGVKRFVRFDWQRSAGLRPGSLAGIYGSRRLVPGAPSPGGTGPGLAQPLKCVSLVAMRPEGCTNPGRFGKGKCRRPGQPHFAGIIQLPRTRGEV